MKVSIVEVGPRDGLQNEKKSLGFEDRVQLVNKLIDAGAVRIEVGAFVSPRKIPQMAFSGDVLKRLNDEHSSKIRSGKLKLSVLVPNEIGMVEAVKAGAQEVAVFTAASDTFTQKNINCTVSESFERFRDVFKLAKQSKIRVRGYLSTCFGCPYEGSVDSKKVVQLVQRLVDMGCYEVSVGDTIGVADPIQVAKLIEKLRKKVPLKKIAMHFHDTRGTALANIYASLTAGIRVFDSSLGGLGGCPYAAGASGNVATEDVVYMLDRMGAVTSFNLGKLIETNHWIAEKLGHSLPSKVSQAGVPKTLN